MTDTKTMPLQMVFIGSEKDTELARAFVNGDSDGTFWPHEVFWMDFKGTINYLDDEFPFERFTTIPGMIARETGILCIEMKDGRLIFNTGLGNGRILKYYAPCDTATTVDTLE